MSWNELIQINFKALLWAFYMWPGGCHQKFSLKLLWVCSFWHFFFFSTELLHGVPKFWVPLSQSWWLGVNYVVQILLLIRSICWISWFGGAGAAQALSEFWVEERGSKRLLSRNTLCPLYMVLKKNNYSSPVWPYTTE